MQRLNRIRRRRLDRVRDGNDAGRLAVDGNEHGGLACGPERIRSVLHCGDVRAFRVHERPVAEKNSAAIHRALDAHACDRLERRRSPERDAPFLDAFDDGLGERMFGALLQRTDEGQQVILVDT